MPVLLRWDPFPLDPNIAPALNPPKKFSESGPFADIYKAINSVLAYSVSTRPVGSGNISVRNTSFGSIVQANATNSTTEETSSVAVKMFKVKSLLGDFIQCREASFSTITGVYSETSETNVLVAKPYKLRKSPFHLRTVDGIAYNYSTNSLRTAVREQYSEDQVIVPAYKHAGVGLTGSANTAFDIIFGMDISGLTNRDYANVFFEESAVGSFGWNAVQWIDLNIDGRAWAVRSVTLP